MSMTLIGLSAALALLASRSSNHAGAEGYTPPLLGENARQSEEVQLHDGRSSLYARDLPAPMPLGRVPVATALNHSERG